MQDRIDDHGSLVLGAAPFPHRLAVRVAPGEGPRTVPVPLAGETGPRWAGTAAGARVSLALHPEPEEGAWSYELSVAAERPVRVELALELPGARAPYPIIPAFLFGENNLDHVLPRAGDPGPGHLFPHLSARAHAAPNVAPFWACRADRASHPVSLIAFEGGVAAVSIEPYLDEVEGLEAGGPASFLRNGLFAAAAAGGAPDACGVSLGYRNTPFTYVNKGRFDPPTQHRLARGSVRGSLHLVPAADRRGVHAVIRQVHARYRRPAEPALAPAEGIRLVAEGMAGPAWIEAAADFADLKWGFEQSRFELLRGPNAEIGWTGGAPSAFPLLVAGHRAGNAPAVERARRVLDRIADPANVNPASGWLWDVVGEDGTRSNDGWWAGMTGGMHCAYTNAEAATYLLHAHAFAREAMGLERRAWCRTALAVLERAVAVQQPDGRFGYTYATGDGRIADPEGFAGCWFIPGLALAHALTGESRFLEAARRGMAHYHGFVRALACWGTPMDTFKAIDQEGVLGFIRGARLLHRITGEAAYLAMLGEGAEYEFLWRYAIAARPERPPLAGSPWRACGGSVTSTSNPHIHPMGLLVSGDLAYLAEQTGDPYVRRRLREGLDWALGCLELYPEPIGYGFPGALTERFCPSDGLLIERDAAGHPASVWFTHHVWGAANALEGLLAASGESPPVAG